MRQLFRRIGYLIRQRQLDADLREELQFHRATKQRDLEQEGVDPLAARIAASRALGSQALAQDESRDVVSLLLTVVTGIASVWPARSASRIDPATVLRSE